MNKRLAEPIRHPLRRVRIILLSLNIPPQQLDKAIDAYDNKAVPLFVYCHSGARSRQAAAVLQSMGYTNVTNIGGIAAYSGKVER